MSNTFDFNRFGKVISLDVKRYVSQFGLTFLILSAMPIVLWLFSLAFGFTMPCVARVAITSITVWLSAILVPAKAFGHINLQRDGVSFAMLPASNIEKFLSIAILCILTPIAVMACSYGIDSLLTLLPWGGFDKFVSSGVMQSINDYLISIAAYGDDVEETKSIISLFDHIAANEELYMFVSALFTVGLFLLGNSLFKTHKTAKTLALMIGMSYVASMVMQVFMLSNGEMAEFRQNPSDFTFDKANILIRTVFLSREIIDALLAVGLFVGTFFKLKNQKY